MTIKELIKLHGGKIERETTNDSIEKRKRDLKALIEKHKKTLKELEEKSPNKEETTEDTTLEDVMEKHIKKRIEESDMMFKYFGGF